ncbi:ATP-dependent DNA helicase DDX31 isoform X1 [Brevipalpus obovatus]|uniref:ATP-dependent DNA helicase DDX31 isoform X1 n=1 Tax=Brevipalpus obovatus TaxID=246614 RepID=UPI003D9E939D
MYNPGDTSLILNIKYDGKSKSTAKEKKNRIPDLDSSLKLIRDQNVDRSFDINNKSSEETSSKKKYDNTDFKSTYSRARGKERDMITKRASSKTFKHLDSSERNGKVHPESNEMELFDEFPSRISRPFRQDKRKLSESLDDSMFKFPKSQSVFKVKKLDREFVPSIFSHNPEVPNIHLKKVKPVQESLFSSKKFSDLANLHPHLISCLENRLKIEAVTKVQQLTIPVILEGKDVLIKSATGSGKTLAYLVPIIQRLREIEPKISRSDGIHCLIIVPTRELVLQCFQTVSTLCQSAAWLVPGCLMGGEKKKSEKRCLRKGLTILIATPGRLIDHIKTTTSLKLNNLQYLVIDEADRLREQGFEEAIGEIISHLKECSEVKRQSVLLSATLTKGVQELAGLTLENPTVIDLSENKSSTEEDDCFALPPQLRLHYIIIPAKLRMVLLCSFIVNYCSKQDLKALIFMSTQDSVDFHHAIFTQILDSLIGESNMRKVKFFRLHGNMEQSDRMTVFSEFQSTKAGILLCTDVAARGLDLPLVDWIVQFNCPSKVEEFVHRVGRTARIGARGDALIFILPSEVAFLQALQDALQINFDECDPENLIKSLLLIKLKGRFLGTRNPREFASKLQQDFEKIIYEDEHLLDSAKKAYLAYLRAYASYPREMKNVLPFKDLHLGHVATSFCLHDSPKALGAGSYLLRQTQAQHFRSFDYKTNRKKVVPTELRLSEFDSGLPGSKKNKT